VEVFKRFRKTSKPLEPIDMDDEKELRRRFSEALDVLPANELNDLRELAAKALKKISDA
jgi:hypothetical protein